jgi:hypothetical protein
MILVRVVRTKAAELSSSSSFWFNGTEWLTREIDLLPSGKTLRLSATWTGRGVRPKAERRTIYLRPDAYLEVTADPAHRSAA